MLIAARQSMMTGEKAPVIQNVRMRIDGLRAVEANSGGKYRIQLARIYLCTPDGTSWLWPSGTTATATLAWEGSEGPNNLILNPSTTNGKYCSITFTLSTLPIYLTINSSTPIPTEYSHWRWKSGNDARQWTNRDPMNFAFEIEMNGEWVQVDSITNCPPAGANLVTAYEGTWWRN